MGRVAVLGAGRMGLPIVRALVRAGREVVVSDVRAEVADPVREAGAVWAAGVQELLADAEVLLTVLPGGPELSVVKDDVLAASEAGMTWIELTSAAPPMGPELASAAAAHGAGFLEAPLGGGPEAAAAASVTLYVGGDGALLERHRALLGSFAAHIHHCGPPGTGYLSKLLINQLWFGQAVAVTEALLLGRAGGVSPAFLGQLLSGSPAASAFVDDYLPALLAGDRLPSFGLDRVVEELESLRRLAAANQLPTPVADAVASVHHDALRHFGPVNGELLGAAYLEHMSGRRLGPAAGPRSAAGGGA
jgi:3-hydroxyisobutyrate dehydrogenase-like beta-hydroxyacid dehydrogenase